MSLDPRAIHIYTDGPCYRNPGGDSAAIVHFPEDLGLPDEQIVNFGCGESSTNRMELLACVKALRPSLENTPAYPALPSHFLEEDKGKEERARPRKGEPRTSAVPSH